METKFLELRKIRDFGEILNATFIFLKQNYKPLFKALLTFAGPFILLSAIATGYYQSNALNATFFTFNPGMNSVLSYFEDIMLSLLLLIVASALSYTMIITTVYSYMKLYALHGKEGIVFEDIGRLIGKNVLRIFGASIVAFLVIMIGMIGLFTEIKTPGWGLAGTAGVIALALFFGTSYILQLATIWEIIIFVVGVILLIIEIFVIPGFGIAGFAGIVLMILGLFFGLISDLDIASTNSISIAIIQLAGSFVMTAVVIYFLWKLLPKSETFNRLILHDNLPSKSGYAANSQYEQLVGVAGTALTDLRPSGTAIFNGLRADVITDGDYIPRHSEIVVIRVEGSKVVVEKK
ncbi:MAG: hypothetical protein A2275_08305 [Bacteroidetes bacterium RIFOXYA12_FULL_35_11]|nr:MAG: hypothetical protein A2275_08305 [Bacteroidetes bacterium RIFOXYA12_FULL_35_11]